MTTDHIKHMVERFLSWKLPGTFSPDGGVTFTPPRDASNGVKHWPVGTNLLSYQQAFDMFVHVTEGLPPTEGTTEAELEVRRLTARVVELSGRIDELLASNNQLLLRAREAEADRFKLIKENDELRQIDVMTMTAMDRMQTQFKDGVKKITDTARELIDDAGVKFLAIQKRNGHLDNALNLALARLSTNEPGDSRAVSNEFVAMAAVHLGVDTPETHEVICAALAKMKQSGV